MIVLWVLRKSDFHKTHNKINKIRCARAVCWCNILWTIENSVDQLYTSSGCTYSESWCSAKKTRKSQTNQTHFIASLHWSKNSGKLGTYMHRSRIPAVTFITHKNHENHIKITTITRVLWLSCESSTRLTTKSTKLDALVQSADAIFCEQLKTV